MAKSITFKINEEEEEEFRFLFETGKGKRFQDRSKAIKESLRLMVTSLE